MGDVAEGCEFSRNKVALGRRGVRGLSGLGKCGGGIRTYRTDRFENVHSDTMSMKRSSHAIFI
jgi:hypothetical protein